MNNILQKIYNKSISIIQSKNVYNLINICYNINVHILYENLLERRILRIFTIVKGGVYLWLVKKERKKVDANQAENLDN